MRLITEIIIHCTATRPNAICTVESIRRYHKSLGWYDIGYHYVIYPDGSVHAGRPVEQSGAHTEGHNAHSIGIAYVGGLDADMEPLRFFDYWLKGIENGVVGGFTRITDKVVEQLLTREGESVEEAKARMAKEQSDREEAGKARMKKQQEQIRAQIEKAQEFGKASIPEIKINK